MAKVNIASNNRNIRNKDKHSVKAVKKNFANKHPSGFTKNKRKWVPEHKTFDGSIQEGQGFAFKRKLKVQHEYKKLLRKGKNGPRPEVQYGEDYPDHLRHLYLAEAEKLKQEERMNRLRRAKGKPTLPEEDPTVDREPRADVGSLSAPTDVQEDEAAPAPGHSEPAEPYSNRNKKKMRKMTSYQKTKEDYKRIQEKRAKKKEEALRSKKQREEAIKIYKQKKFETYQILSKKTKKGQPNLNLQMEYLLQKIQEQRK